MGFFERVSHADFHVHLDDVQFIRRSYFSRNKVLDSQGRGHILSVPVTAHRGDSINQTLISGTAWKRKHQATLKHCYGKSKHAVHLNAISSAIDAEYSTLADLNIALIDILADSIGVSTPTFRASALNIPGSASERLINLCHHFGATTYYSPAGARAYINEETFSANGIRLGYQRYQPLPYEQKGTAEFVSHLSILDALLRHGSTVTKEIVQGSRACAE